MIALPIELEQQVIQFAEFEHKDPITFLKNVIADYVARVNQNENDVLADLADDVLALNEPSLSQDDAMRLLNELVD